MSETMQAIDASDIHTLLTAPGEASGLTEVKAKVLTLYRMLDRRWPDITAEEAEALASKLRIPATYVTPVLREYLGGIA